MSDLNAGGLDVRLYRPAADAVPLVVYLHGGGWTIGSVETHDRVCRRLGDVSGCAVLSVNYRLAPEHPWPASVDDAVAAVRWAARAGAAQVGALTGAIAVAGDSAGGTLAALACLRLRDEHPESLPDLQVLLNANTDLTGDQPSIREKAAGWGLEAPMIRFFNSQWVPDETMWSHPDVSPLWASDLFGLPEALVSPPSTILCATKPRPTPTVCAPPEPRSTRAASPASSTTSSCSTRSPRPVPPQPIASPATSEASSIRG